MHALNTPWPAFLTSSTKPPYSPASVSVCATRATPHTLRHTCYATNRTTQQEALPEQKSRTDSNEAGQVQRSKGPDTTYRTSRGTSSTPRSQHSGDGRSRGTTYNSRGSNSHSQDRSYNTSGNRGGGNRMGPSRVFQQSESLGQLNGMLQAQGHKLEINSLGSTFTQLPKLLSAAMGPSKLLRCVLALLLLCF